MADEHIVSTSEKATADFVNALGHGEKPLSKLRRKLGWYKVDKALKDLESLSEEFSKSLQEEFADALKKIEHAVTEADKDVRDSLVAAEKDIEFGLVQVYSKKHEGKETKHVRINKNVSVNQKGRVTVMKVSKEKRVRDKL